MKTSKNSGRDRIDLPLGRFADPTSDAGFKAIFCDDMMFCRTDPGWQERYIAEYSLTEKEAGDVIADTIYVIFVEQYRFNKTLDECRTDAELLMWTLKNQKTLEDIPVKLKGIPPIVSLLESAEAVAAL